MGNIEGSNEFSIWSLIYYKIGTLGPRKLKLVPFASVEYKSNIDKYEVEESSEEENVPTHDEYDDSRKSGFALYNPLDLSEYDGFIAIHSNHSETGMADEYDATDNIMNEYDSEDKEDMGNAIERKETNHIKDLAIQDYQNKHGSFKNEDTLVQLTNDYYDNVDASYDLERLSESNFSEKSFQDYHLQEFKQDAVEEPVFSRSESEASHMALRSGNSVAVGAQVSDMLYTVSSGRSISANLSSVLIAIVVLSKVYFTEQSLSNGL